MRPLFAEVVEPFYHDHRPNKPLIILFVLINVLVLVNAYLHDPTKGYDAGDHIHYIKTLAEDRRIPTCADSAQCYIPPLPYMWPALLVASGTASLLLAAKLAQLTNVIISLGLTYYLLKICALLDPAGIAWRFSSLALFGMLPVFYKTFSLIRGEVYLPLLIVFITYLLLSIFIAGRSTVANFVLLGIAMGLAILARQWGFLILPAVFLFMGVVVLKDRSKFRVAIYAGTACLVFQLILAGWYYAIMYSRYGSLTAWDRPASAISLSDYPLEFYFGTGSGKLFTDPIRPSFSNQFPSIFYADTWGDYSAYFLIYVRNTQTGDYLTGKDLQHMILSSKPIPDTFDTNRFTMNAYLGRVNLVSLIPSLILVAGFLYGLGMVWRSISRKDQPARQFGSVLFTLVILCSMAGYGWYLLRFQDHGQGGDLIKATHMMQIFPFLGLLGGQVLQKVQTRAPRVWLAVMIVLAVIVLHNLPAMITHYPILP